jgi:DNA-binding NtrC family response regulator
VKPEKAHGPQILLVDDNPTNLQVLYQTLEGNGYRLLAARSGKDAISIAERAVPDLILLDVMMPDMDGFETCTRLKLNARTRESAIIFLSALTEAREKVRGLQLGAVDFVNKPFQAEEVLARVRTHLTIRDLQKQLHKRNEELQHELTVAQELLREARDRTDGVLLGDSAEVVRLRHDIQEAAKSDETLLISGPPGSDHEAVARAVHHQSRRAARAIICVSCLSGAPGATPLQEKTGSLAILDKLSLADGGTLYLEGVQQLPRESQRILAARLGASSDARPSAGYAEPNVRMIVSTTRDVDEELAAGRLIPELRRALPLTLDLPPLRARLDDLSTIAPYILRRQAEQAGRTVPIISDESMKRLKSHRWPGNLRELRNVLGTALAASQDVILEIGDHLLDNSLMVGSYSLIERLGSGGMGEVWLGRHRLLARPAAIKIVREAAVGAAGEDGHALRQRFAREAQTTAELQSPHTVQLFDFGVADTGGFYYVMERLRGMDLQRMVERHGPLPPERAVFLLKQACLSLSEAHGLGLVHRDIKPANLFVCRLGAEYDFLKVLDFGVVSRRGRETMESITVSGMVLGTPAFLAPELISGRSFDQRADIYSLGCVAFWLLTGRPPFEGSDAMAVLMQHANTAPLPPSSVSEVSIPAAVDAVVLECLSKDTALRPSTADALWQRLDKLSVDAGWGQQRARTWWELHEPELISKA